MPPKLPFQPPKLPFRPPNLHEIRADYPHADPVGSCVVFNIGGNKYRLIARVFYAALETKGRAYVLHVLSHEEYDDGRWKTDCDC